MSNDYSPLNDLPKETRELIDAAILDFAGIVVEQWFEGKGTPVPEDLRWELDDLWYYTKQEME